MLLSTLCFHYSFKYGAYSLYVSCKASTFTSGSLKNTLKIY